MCIRDRLRISQYLTDFQNKPSKNLTPLSAKVTHRVYRLIKTVHTKPADCWTVSVINSGVNSKSQNKAIFQSPQISRENTPAIQLYKQLYHQIYQKRQAKYTVLTFQKIIATVRPYNQKYSVELVQLFHKDRPTKTVFHGPQTENISAI